MYDVGYSQWNELKQLKQSPVDEVIDDEDLKEVGDGEDDDSADVCEDDEDDGDSLKVDECGVVNVDSGNVVDEDDDVGSEFASNGEDKEDDVELASVTLKCCDF